MYRGTTPTICFTLLSNLDMEEISTVWITFSMPRRQIVVKGDRVVLNVLSKKMYVSLNQEETLSFGTGTVKVQARILMKDGSAYATDVGELEVKGVLTDGVIEDEHDADSDPDGGTGDGTENPDGGTGDGTEAGA